MKKNKSLFLCTLFSLILLKFLVTEIATAEVVPIRIGVVLDMDDFGKAALSSLSMARDDFYGTHGHYKTRLDLISRDSKGTVVGAAAAALDLIKNVQVQAIIGPMFSHQASFLISLGDKSQVPIISFSASNPSLSSIPTPYFVRTILNDSSQVYAIGAIVEAFGWREVVPIYEDNSFGRGIITYLTDALEDVNARVPYRCVIPQNASDDQIVAELYKLMTMHSRVFVVHMMNPLTSRLFTKAKQLGMMSSDYAWIVTDGITYEFNTMKRDVKESMLGIIGVKPYVPSTKELDDFVIRFKERAQQDNPMVSRPETDDLEFFLWAYDSVTALAMAAEQAKLINPKYTEANHSRNATDLEAYGVSDAGPKLIQAISSTRFRGLAGDFHLVDGQLQASSFRIMNMVGPGARVIGYWTKQNGIVKELNSDSSNKSAKSTSKSNLGTIIWPGDKSNPPKGWVIPTNGKKLRVGVPVKSGFNEFVRVTWNPDNSTNVEGYCIEVFDAVMAALPYGVSYEYIPFATPDKEMAGNYNDLTRQVSLGNYDVVVGDVTITSNRSKDVDFTLPFAQSGISMVVPFKDDTSETLWAFLKPLTWELWLTSLCSFVFIGFLIWILEHRINEDFRGPFWHQVGMIPWFAFSTIVFAHKERVISNLAKFVLIIWFLVVLILTQSYTASLASMLTVQKLTPSVEDVNDLITSKQNVGYTDTSFIHGFLKDIKFDESQLKPFDTAEKMDELLSMGSRKGGIAAAFHEEPYLKLFLREYGSKYTMVGPLYKADGFGFVFPKGSPLVPDVSRAILHVTEEQKMGDIERKWLGDITKFPDSNTLSTAPRNLGVASFCGLFLIVGIAGIAALMIYVINFLWKNWDVIEKSSTTRSKLAELLQIFNEEDRNSHTFKKTNHGYCSDSPYPSCQSTSKPTSRYATYPPSPDFSIHTLHPKDQMQSPRHAETHRQGETSQSTNLCRASSTGGIV